MITVLFFARLREDVGIARVELAAADLHSIADVVEMLVADHGERMRQALAGTNIIVAINHEVADFAAAVRAGDEVAFYPPVSGG